MRPRRRPIIAVVGVDGAGKSTQGRLLAAWLKGQGLPAAYFENSGGRLVLDRLGRMAGRGDGRELLGRGYGVVEATIRWLAICRALLISRLTGRIAVMDRYAYCQYALVRARGERGEPRLRRLFSCFPRPSIVCLLCVPALVAYRRVELRGRDHEEPAYLAAFDAAYRSLPEFASFHIIDAAADPVAVQVALQTAVAPALDGHGHQRMDDRTG